MTTKTDLVQPVYNSSNWHVPLNSNFGIVNDALGSTESVNLSASDVTLTTTQAQKMRILVSGALPANRTLYFPSGVTGFWIVTNATTGNYTVTVSNVSGVTTIQVGLGTSALLYSDGTNMLPANSSPSTGAVPPGAIIPYGGSTAPYGYLSCDGAAVSRTTYAALFNAIGTSWGAGDGSTTFALPDLRGYFLRGLGTNADGTASGAFANKVADTLKSHTHSVTDTGHSHSVTQWGGIFFSAGALSTHASSTNNIGPSISTNSATTGISIGSTGGSETAPKCIAVPYCIKF